MSEKSSTEPRMKKELKYALLILGGLMATWILIATQRKNYKIQPALLDTEKDSEIRVETLTSNIVRETEDFRTQLCTKRRHIAFLKVHKCGSTTVSNILHRFAILNDLNLVLPNKRGKPLHWILGDLSNFTKDMILPLPTKSEYNILAVETVYNKSVYQELIKPNPYFVAIIREPVERFISYIFFTKTNHVKGKPYIIKNAYLQDHEFTMASKGMSLDFGMKYENIKPLVNLKSFAANILNDFDFIMLTEYFDESLVYLKRELCWETKDIIYVPQNVNKQKRHYALDFNDTQVIRRLTPADNILYDQVKRVFFWKISKLGTEFMNEVFHFKTILRRISDYCIHGMKYWKYIHVPSSKWNSDFQVTSGDCRYLLMSEELLVGNLQERAWKKYQNS